MRVERLQQEVELELDIVAYDLKPGRPPEGLPRKEASAELAEGTETVYYWTVARTASPPESLRHIWYADGRQTAVVSLTVRHPRTRTWSSKNVWPGSWKVEAVADDGRVLAVAEFTVK